MTLGESGRSRLSGAAAILVAALSFACGEAARAPKDRYVTTGSTEWIDFVASLERQAPTLEHVEVSEISARLAEDPLLRDGLLKVARDAGFDEWSEVLWVRTSADPGSGASKRLAFKLLDRRGGRDLEWWGRVSRVDSKIEVDQVMGSEHSSE